MENQNGPLYDADEAACLQRREAWWGRDNDEKFALLLPQIGACRRLVDIGCGWGQFLHAAQGCAEELWGVDESPDRVKDVAEACPQARVVVCRADALDLPDGYFDVAVTSQMLHEVRLFGAAGDEARTLGEIHRVLASGGRYFLLDHADAGEGETVVRLPDEVVRRLAEFEAKYRFYDATHEVTGEETLRLTRRCLQDYLTKDWALDTPMESMEMNETHNVFEREETVAVVQGAGFRVSDWIPFADIRDDLRRVGGELLEGEPWCRKFILVASKNGRSQSGFS